MAEIYADFMFSSTAYWLLAAMVQKIHIDLQLLREELKKYISNHMATNTKWYSQLSTSQQY